jgi:hypothetical protein
MARGGFDYRRADALSGVRTDIRDCSHLPFGFRKLDYDSDGMPAALRQSKVFEPGARRELRS